MSRLESLASPCLWAMGEAAKPFVFQRVKVSKLEDWISQDLASSSCFPPRFVLHFAGKIADEIALWLKSTSCWLIKSSCLLVKPLSFVKSKSWWGLKSIFLRGKIPHLVVQVQPMFFLLQTPRPALRSTFSRLKAEVAGGNLGLDCDEFNVQLWRY